MRLVVGLGNPGPEYEETRHNVGFAAVDRLAGRLGLRFDRLRIGWLKRSLGEFAVDRDRELALLKPLTFMNRSGEAVVEAVKRLGVEPSAVMAVADDFALPLGQLRIRKDGSSGGQKGLQSIVDCLGTQEFPRLRVGIGSPRGEAVDHVLSRFSKAERREVEASLDRATDALERWLRDGDIDRCMNEFNKRLERE